MRWPHSLELHEHMVPVRRRPPLRSIATVVQHSALYGVNEPDPDVDYFGVQIPLTRPLEAGERFQDEFRLVPLVLHDHFSRGSGETQVQGTVRLRCRFAYGLTPIDKASRLQMSINSLLEWQQWVDAPELQVDLTE